MLDFKDDFYRQFIYYRTYARWVEEKGRREFWDETVDRYMSFMKENLGNKLSKKEYTMVRDSIFKMEVMPSMRLLWSAGDAARRTNVTAYNCSFTTPTKLRSFGEILYLLTCGCGVGFSVENKFVSQLPDIKVQKEERPDTYSVPDTREGWADALVKGMTTWYSGGDIKFNYSLIRPLGAKLKTMGGRASGAEPLISLLDFTRNIILSRQGRKLRPIDVHDIITKIGEVVVAGGTRRSAEISLSDLNDDDLRFAKAGSFWETNPNRMMANNSAVYEEKPEMNIFLREWISLMESGTGERGIFNRAGTIPERRLEVLGDRVNVLGTNPCLTGDTVIATLDGPRTFKELSESGDAVPVYSWDPKTKKPVIRMMNRPHRTGKDVRVIEVEFDSGLKVKATPNHGFYTQMGKKVRAEDLRVGQSVKAFSASIHRDGHMRVHSWDASKNGANHQWVSRMVYDLFNGKIEDGNIIHHKDGNPLNNSPDNLYQLTVTEHNSLHYQDRFKNGFDGVCKNHKVVSIKEAGFEDVYNGMVDDSHTYIILDPEPVAGIMSGIVSSNCGEILLQPKQFCNLSEVVARAEDTRKILIDKMKVASILGTYQSSLTNFGYLSNEWSRNSEEERLLGVSVTGQQDCPVFRDNPKFMVQMRDCAVETNKEYAKRFGINPSSSVTAVKPSGTVSQLTNASSGLHARFSPYYIRRVRISSTDPLFSLMKDMDITYHPEVGQQEETAHTFVLEFPVASPEGAVFTDEMKALEQLEYWNDVKINYTEHNPSATIYVESSEWLEVGAWVYKNWDTIGGLSFLPKTDHIYKLAPYERITKSKYERMVKELSKIDFSHITDYEKSDMGDGRGELACDSNKCEIDLI